MGRLARYCKAHTLSPHKATEALGCELCCAQNLRANLVGCLKWHLNVFWDESSEKRCSGLCLTDIPTCQGAGGWMALDLLQRDDQCG